MATLQKISSCLWFDDQAEEAANFYMSVFKDAELGRVSKYSEAGFEIHQKPAGSVMAVEFFLEGERFMALNGGPLFKFSAAISFVINCDTQEEIDYYWEKLGEDADENAQQCGWLKDKFGLSWQVVPTAMANMFLDHESEASQRAMNAMLHMKKLDIEKLQQAFNQE